MSGVTIGANLNNGFAGTYARTPDCIIDTHPVVAGGVNVYFGDPVIDAGAGAIKKADATATAANFVGIAACEVKTALSYTAPNDGGYFVADEAAAILQRGSISAVCQVGTPAKNGKVYLRVAVNSAIPAGVVGGLEAAADGNNTVELTNCRWGSTKDANGVASLIVLTRNAA